MDIPFLHCLSHGLLKHGRLLRFGGTDKFGFELDSLASVDHGLVVSQLRGLLDPLSIGHIVLAASRFDGAGVSRVLSRSLESARHGANWVW